MPSPAVEIASVTSTEPSTLASASTSTSTAPNPAAGDVEMATATAHALDGEQAAQQPEPEPEQEQEEEEPRFEVVYINNLNEKVKLAVMKQSLTTLFKEYGKVLGVTLHRNVRMRGQAFVTLLDPKAAQLAVKEVKGFPLYGKPMQLAFAKTRSDALVKKKDPQHMSEHIAERTVRKKVSRRENPLRKKELQKKLAAKQAAEAAAAASSSLPDAGASTSASTTANGAPTSTTTTAAPRRQVQMPDEYLPPNKILFIQNLPSKTTKAHLEAVFAPYPGLVEVRTIPGRSNIAFVEFVDEVQSAPAKEALHNTKPWEEVMPGDEEAGLRIKVTFAKM
ncbi:BZ3500_MvSof-1268-A1-R1_Chr7-1g09373 [Microbotryum saponariae]|uniref:BZ3500_MvSof-1268-A1-R1_Chr7-1g09373 protein n=1 Tax=Microbotryum saponariae TaxID=289078 RepID=A0A2X0M2R3_9BASI|nr:BZ3501_MvSof-1269-A2-R1_Chr7-1g09078 [Microbotryum saponariae]SDA03315.1 BZ3500_MvSof-1268-A1-R1_Chr7-1g09373 [Microbotryum saponariae]